jgi:hypothetical protein
LKPQTKNKKAWWVGGLPLDSGWLSGQNCKWIIIFDMCWCQLGCTKIISWYYSNIILVQFAVLNYIVVNDNNIIVYSQLANSCSQGQSLWFCGPVVDPHPRLNMYQPIMLTIEVGTVVRPSEYNILLINLLFARFF